MTLEPLFTAKDNKLYKIADNSLVDLNSIKKIDLAWSQLELEPEHYNEELLANLRNDLKAMEESGEFAIIVPVIDRAVEDYEDQEAIIAAYNHAARRIKDATSVVGFEIPAAIEDMNDFVEALSKKHAQYIYFTKAENTDLDVVISY